jgi:hypothetical protein
MSFTLNIKTDFSPQEVSDVIRSALEHEKHVAKYKIKRHSIICENFESKYGFSSGELKAKFEAGKLKAKSEAENTSEESDFFEWYSAKRGFDNWSKKLQILSDISL